MRGGQLDACLKGVLTQHLVHQVTLQDVQALSWQALACLCAIWPAVQDVASLGLAAPVSALISKVFSSDQQKAVLPLLL